eukprot:8130840-Pyramimonas_sp.AAC.1
MGRAINSATHHPPERTYRGYPHGGRTAANLCQKQIPWNTEKERDVGRMGRKGHENCIHVERSAGMWSGLGWRGQE